MILVVAKELLDHEQRATVLKEGLFALWLEYGGGGRASSSSTSIAWLQSQKMLEDGDIGKTLQGVLVEGNAVRDQQLDVVLSSLHDEMMQKLC